MPIVGGCAALRGVVHHLYVVLGLLCDLMHPDGIIATTQAMPMTIYQHQKAAQGMQKEVLYWPRTPHIMPEGTLACVEPQPICAAI